MPATAKRGFRLPWMRDDAGSEAVGTQVLDGRPGDAPSPEADAATEPEAEALDDLGSGPFGIAPPPREVRATRDTDEVLDLEQRTSPEPSADDVTAGEPDADVPKWLRQGPSGSPDGTAPSEPARAADARPGISVVSSIEAPPPDAPVAHEGASAAAWPEADFAARATAAPSPSRLEPGSDREPEPPHSHDPAAHMGVSPSLGEAAQSRPEPEPRTESMAADGAALDATAPGLEPDGSAAASAPGSAAAARSSDQRTAPTRTASPGSSGQPGHERRDNPLLTGLVRAMRDSARTTREETTARLRVEAEARVAAIRARSAADAVALRTQADEDVAGIREWSKAEMVRIRLETAERIEARRTQLATDSRALSSLTGRLVSEIEAAVVSFEAEMKRFFKALLAEEDPAHLATLAERMPEPPVLEALPEAVAVGIDHVSSGARGRANRAAANRAAAKPAKGAKRATRPSTRKPTDGPRPSTRANRRPAAAPHDGGETAAVVGPSLDPGALDPEAAALAEAEALAGLDLSAVTGGDWPVSGVTPSSNGTTSHEPTDDGPEPEPADDELMIESQTRLIVVGLGDAGVAAFEGALRAVSGVGSVNVSPGDEGEVVFSVTHGTATDLRAAVPEMTGFRAHVTADEGAILSVAAHDPH